MLSFQKSQVYTVKENECFQRNLIDIHQSHTAKTVPRSKKRKQSDNRAGCKQTPEAGPNSSAKDDTGEQYNYNPHSGILAHGKKEEVVVKMTS